MILDDAAPGFDLEFRKDDTLEATVEALVDQAGEAVNVEEG